MFVQSHLRGKGRSQEFNQGLFDVNTVSILFLFLFLKLSLLKSLSYKYIQKPLLLRKIYIYIHLELNHFAIYLKLMQDCKSTMCQGKQTSLLSPPSNPGAFFRGSHCYLCLMVPQDLPVHFQTYRYIYAHTETSSFERGSIECIVAPPFFFKKKLFPSLWSFRSLGRFQFLIINEVARIPFVHPSLCM